MRRNQALLGLGLMTLLIMSVLLPMAQAGHFQIYYTDEVPGNKEFIGTFESEPDTTPTSGIPAAFRGLTDRLASTVGYNGATTAGTAGVDGAMVLDSQWADGAATAGPFIPANYYLAQQTGDEESRLFSYGTFMAWHGYFWDVNGNGVIEDEFVHYDGAMDSTEPHRASTTDEFVWRGSSTEETGNSMQAYMFPNDHTVGLLCFPFMCDEEPAGFDGNCNDWDEEGANEPNCYDPRPDFAYADRSASEAGAGNQMYVATSGWNNFFVEPWLVSGLDIVTVMNANTVQSVERYDVGCATSGSTCLRDYDRYTALAGEDASELYLSAMHAVRDETWTREFDVAGQFSISADDVWENGIDLPTELPDVCPTEPSVPVPGEVPIFGGDTLRACGKDTRHIDWDGRGNATDGSGQKSTRKTVAGTNLVGIQPHLSNVGGSFEQYWCNTATGGASQCGSLTGHGVYGFVGTGFGVGGTTQTTMMFHGTGSFLSWDDRNGDGYIGAPSQAEIDAYDAGIDNSPNDLCINGPDCEINGHASVFAGKLVRVWPCQDPVNGACVDGGWPPGAFVSRIYDRWSDGQPFYPDSNWAWHEQSMPMFGGDPVDLRFDDSGCTGDATGCRTRDAIGGTFSSMSTLAGLSIQVGSGTNLEGFVQGASPTFDPGVTLTWTEGSTEFDITHDLTNEYDALPFEDEIAEETS